MCGICGIILRDDGPTQESAVRAMAETIRRRGPDDDGFHSDSRASLGMRRLSVIDLVTGRQPMQNEDASIQVVFNGELYNFLEIRAALQSKGHRFHTQSDSEIIPHLYEEYGEDYAGHLNGMFGIAVWDAKNKKLILTRDRLGVKPLYYAEYPDRLLFGSEAKAILAAPGVSRDLDPFALNQYLTYEYVPPPRSIYTKIKKLAPGEQLTYHEGRVRLRRYWDVPTEPPLDIGVEEAAEQLRELIRDAVRMRLVSDVPLGVFLSGGIDSSTTAAFAAEFSPRINSFCIGFKEPSFDESAYARRAAAAIGTNHHEDILSIDTAIDILPDIFQSLDEPLSDPSVVPTYLLSRFTRRHVTVALSGDGGDELFAGYPTYQAHKLLAIYKRFPILLQRLAGRTVEMIPPSQRNMGAQLILRKFMSGADYPALERHFVWLGPFAPHEKQSIFTDDFHDTIRGQDIFEPARAALGARRAPRPDLESALFLDLRYYLGENLLTKVDRASMMHSLEVRTPFLDYRVVEFAWRLPTTMKLKGWKTKYILKKAVGRVVPPFVLERKKKGFGIPLYSWIRGKLRDNFLETLSPDRLRKDGVFNPETVQTILSQHLAGKIDQRKKLWNLYVFMKWKDRWG